MPLDFGARIRQIEAERNEQLAIEQQDVPTTDSVMEMPHFGDVHGADEIRTPSHTTVSGSLPLPTTDHQGPVVPPLNIYGTDDAGMDLSEVPKVDSDNAGPSREEFRKRVGLDSQTKGEPKASSWSFGLGGGETTAAASARSNPPNPDQPSRLSRRRETINWEVVVVLMPLSCTDQIYGRHRSGPGATPSVSATSLLLTP